MAVAGGALTLGASGDSSVSESLSSDTFITTACAGISGLTPVSVPGVSDVSVAGVKARRPPATGRVLRVVAAEAAVVRTARSSGDGCVVESRL